jgi:alpha-galactosidase/6-phospho-beta-glucosidase family protein
MIRGNGGWDRFKMIEVEKYPCKDNREAERREDEVMKELKASMNTYKSFRTEEERKEYNKDYHKEYREANIDIIKKKDKQYSKEYYETNKEKIQQYREDNREHMKEYYETNKEQIKEKTKEYYETNKEKNKIKCKCGCVVTKYSIKQHERTKKHINLMNPIQ